MSEILKNFNFYDYKKSENTKTIHLLKCPICGKPVVFDTYFYEYLEYGKNLIKCIHCNLHFYGSMDGMTKEQIAEEWNNRVPMQEITEDMRQLEKDYRYETNSGFIDMCIDIVEDVNE